MSKLVVDASVAAKWLVTETLSDRALAVLERSDDLMAPDLLMPEVANLLCSALVDRALEIAIETGRTVYDSMYLALAEREGCSFVTADERLVNALAQRGGTSRAVWLGAPQ